MNKSEPVAQRTSEPPALTRGQLDQLLALLTEKVAVELGEPDHDEQKRDVYLLLHPDVRRLLVQLGRSENKAVLLALLKLDEDDTKDLIAMLRDYREAKKLGRTIKAVALGLGAFLSGVFALVKAAPDALDWLRGFLPK